MSVGEMIGIFMMSFIFDSPRLLSHDFWPEFWIFSGKYIFFIIGLYLFTSKPK